MRILHTSDWHLGRTLEGRSRFPEQVEFIDQLCDIAEQERAQLVLVAGDVFDTYNPSAEAEQLFFSAMERLAAGGERAAVVIAGNHDSPDRIRAATPLALKHGISLLGYPGEQPPAGRSSGRVHVVRAGRGWLEIALPGAAETAVVYTLPYPSESRLNEILSEDLDEAVQQLAYSARIERAFQEAGQAFRRDTVNLVAGHIFVAGGWESESERQIQLGGALAVEPHALPAGAQYIALGHLHRPQEVRGAPVPCRYSGSPLAYSFSEADQQKEVVIIDAALGGPTRVTPVKLTRGKPLKRWSAASLQEVHAWCGEAKNLECWVDLEVRAEQPLTAAQVAELRRIHPGIVNVRVILPELAVQGTERRLSEMSLAEQFKLFCMRERGVGPSTELLDLFLRLANEGEGDSDGQYAVEPAGGEVA